MITRRDLVQCLARSDLGAWSVVERVQDIAIADELRALSRRERRTHLTLIVHHDVPRGRGTARLDLDASDGSADDVIDQAVALALAAVGPSWLSTPPAAPARVNLADGALVKRDLAAVAADTLARLRRPADLAVAASVEVLRENVTVVASSGFRTSWVATTVDAGALVAMAGGTGGTASGGSASGGSASGGTASGGTASGGSASGGSASGGTPSEGMPSGGIPGGGMPSGSIATMTALLTGDRSLTVSRQARRIADLGLDAALADAAIDLAYLVAARAPAPGPCALWLGPEALLHGGDHGVWAIFAHQADSTVERQGLTRYRWRSEIIPGAAQLVEPLTITSDGALDFATRSTPVTDDAVAIRQFPLIQRGVAVGLGLSPREAAIRKTDPNGGVCNLVVEPGSWTGTPSPTARTLEVRRLHALAIDLYTGDATLDIALGLEHRPDRPDPTPFTGGTIRLDLVTALARAHRASQLLHRGAYHGPASVLIDDAELLA